MLADYLDQCLKDSYWQRRLLRTPADGHDIQQQLVRGRAVWLWAKTTTQKRAAYFGAGIGFAAGEQIADRLTEIGEHISGAESGLESGDLDEAASHTVELAHSCTRSIHLDANPLRKIGGNYSATGCRGTPLGQFADNEGINFIQQDVVYHLVWAVEAARLHVQCLTDDGDAAPGEMLAQCLTYGVPHRTAAVFMQGGLRSRVMATAILARLDRSIDDMDALREWVDDLRAGNIATITLADPSQETEWQHFLAIRAPECR